LLGFLETSSNYLGCQMGYSLHYHKVGQSVSRTDDLKPMPAKSKIKGNVSKKKAPVDD